ncbi:ribbon-helix-helix protein, CopG family [Aquifex aeolicus]|uniref:ribbon-helix-helix protein, CopG family n=1 Tax=Aquifex aeolicus TaxID=63363 RepID=UPI0002ED2B53|nr:ribbon-helix-helix protein, CopG family [Aquifex aeolicus]
MKRTTIFINEETKQKIKLIAKKKQKSMAEIIREAINEYIVKHKKNKKYSFIGLGKSKRSDISEIHEEKLWKYSQ